MLAQIMQTSQISPTPAAMVRVQWMSATRSRYATRDRRLS